VPKGRQSAEVSQFATQIDGLAVLWPQPLPVLAWQLAPACSHAWSPVHGFAHTLHQHSEPSLQSADVSQACSQFELLPDELAALPHAPASSTKSTTQNPMRARILSLLSIV
jgi:hypothetical protein